VSHGEPRTVTGATSGQGFPKGRCRVATDVGGTFTDIVYCEEVAGDAALFFAKVDSTPPDFEKGVRNALTIAGVDPASIELFIHGSTVVINALTERRGARVGFVTTRGFRDVLAIGRANRPDMYNIRSVKPESFIERQFCAEITERLDFRGQVLQPPKLEELDAILEGFRRERVEAIGLCLLHAYADAAHENLVAAAIRARLPGVPLVASHEICREWREYERSSTTVLTAYVKPVVSRYLAALQDGLGGAGFRGRAYVMQSNGGIARFATGEQNPISLVESGPAAGMFGAVAWGGRIGHTNMLALDIGGTTAKCSLIENGQVRMITDYRIERSRTNAGHPIRTPVVDIVEIGTGGGSIAWVDDGGRLHVGPRSAGAMPGPIAYGRGGTMPTTTDANLWTGRINRERFMGGQMQPRMDLVEAAFDTLGVQLAVSSEAAARGILRVANASMVNALKLISVNRGRDPQDSPLMAFGGGGPLHAAFLAAELRIPTVIVPPHPSVFSAWGMLLSDARRDYFRTLVAALTPEEPGRLVAAFRALEREARDDLAAELRPDGDLFFHHHLELRYQGQEHTIRIPCGPDLFADLSITQTVASFHSMHELEFTFRLDAPIVVVGLHLAARVPAGHAGMTPSPPSTGHIEAAVTDERVVDFDQYGRHLTRVYDRMRVPPEQSLDGPVLIEEANTVTVVPPGFSAVVDAFGNVILTNHTGPGG
jgi:N-methylhydantoinase A